VTLLASLIALTGTFLVINVQPRLVMTVLGLHRLGPLPEGLPPEAPPVAARATPLETVDILAPPWIPQPLSLTAQKGLAAGVGAPPLTGDATVPGKTTYHLTISEDGLNDLVQEHFLALAEGDEHRHGLWVDVRPGGLVLTRDIDVGLTEHRVGLFLVQDGTTLTLTPARVLLNDEFYQMPEPRSLAALLMPKGRQVQRALEGVSVTGPLPGDAKARALYLREDYLIIEAEATYALSALADTGWRVLGAGLERREIEVPANAERGSERLRMIRLAPSSFDVRVLYDPMRPKTISDWAAASGGLLTVNGGYFSPESERGYETIGLLVSNGQRWGTPLQDFAGMLAVGHDGQVSVRWLRHRPYDPAQPLAQALQSFPVLVKPGGIMGFPEGADDGTPARRTVVGQDSAGNLIFVLAPRGTMSLHDLAVLLAEPGLGLDVAVNLDGGRSSGMWLEGTEWDVTIDSVTPVPSAVVIYQR
jgi:hypothetical protein